MMYSIIAALLLQASAQFWNFWGDGKAEISTYAAMQNRYGEERTAAVTLIYVTEPFNTDKQVKSDHYETGSPAITNVLKLNRVKDFQTGIYDYNLMTSVFSATAPFKIYGESFKPGQTVKVGFSGQEWCGLVHHQLNLRKNGYQSSLYSYFESEGDHTELIKSDQPLIPADDLFIRVRELIRPFPEGSYNILPMLESARLFHFPLKKITVNVKKREIETDWKNSLITATEFEISGGDFAWTFLVEKAYPKKILRYRISRYGEAIESGHLQKSTRLPYWQLNSNKDEVYLREIMINAK